MIAVTHDGVFHADDVCAAAVIRLVDPDADIQRTRDSRHFEGADIVFDVGGGEYDHHQRGGNGERNGIPYAAFGLVWRRFGRELCDGDQAVADEVDRLLAQPVDAADNGVSLATPARTDVLPVTVSSVISWWNPSWDEAEGEEHFNEAVEMARQILRRAIVRARGKVLAPREIGAAIAAATDPRVIMLERFLPWQEVLVTSAPQALYVVYPSAGTWRVQGVPARLGQPDVRRPLPAAWAGLDAGGLATLTGVDDATFAHRGLFIAGAVSREGALKLAALALMNVEWSDFQ